MTRFGIDALTAVRLVREGIVVPGDHQLVAPNLLRSQALSLIYREVRGGELSADEARTMLDRITTMRIRLLGDRVSRAVAWRVAEQLGWDDTSDAEYVAVAQLQADAFVTLDADLARAVSGIVTIAPFEALLGVD
ncbi:MAG TPA: type II toxin-antitoxin system VapC family toxin [Terrimesophilobacter sp.]|nr:type II toxin-antitoxin system VapC family toxin [Terrimesophilobacter sp.]